MQQGPEVPAIQTEGDGQPRCNKGSGDFRHGVPRTSSAWHCSAKHMYKSTEVAAGTRTKRAMPLQMMYPVKLQRLVCKVADGYGT